MSPSARRKQIHALRIRQTKIATVVLADARCRLNKIETTATQLAALADSLAPSRGTCDAISLRTSGELATRLREAVQDLQHPILHARHNRDHQLARRVEAEWRETGAKQLADKALRDADRLRDLRLAANRPHRPQRSNAKRERGQDG